MRYSVLLTILLAGCGTTRVTDTARSATEQLLISHSIDQAISEMDVTALRGKKARLAWSRQRKNERSKTWQGS